MAPRCQRVVFCIASGAFSTLATSPASNTRDVLDEEENQAGQTGSSLPPAASANGKKRQGKGGAGAKVLARDAPSVADGASQVAPRKPLPRPVKDFVSRCVLKNSLEAEARNVARVEEAFGRRPKGRVKVLMRRPSGAELCVDVTDFISPVSIVKMKMFLLEGITIPLGYLNFVDALAALSLAGLSVDESAEILVHHATEGFGLEPILGERPRNAVSILATPAFRFPVASMKHAYSLFLPLAFPYEAGNVVALRKLLKKESSLRSPLKHLRDLMEIYSLSASQPSMLDEAQQNSISDNALIEERKQETPSRQNKKKKKRASGGDPASQASQVSLEPAGECCSGDPSSFELLREALQREPSPALNRRSPTTSLSDLQQQKQGSAQPQGNADIVHMGFEAVPLRERLAVIDAPSAPTSADIVECQGVDNSMEHQPFADAAASGQSTWQVVRGKSKRSGAAPLAVAGARQHCKPEATARNRAGRIPSPGVVPSPGGTTTARQGTVVNECSPTRRITGSAATSHLPSGCVWGMSRESSHKAVADSTNHPPVQPKEAASPPSSPPTENAMPKPPLAEGVPSAGVFHQLREHVLNTNSPEREPRQPNPRAEPSESGGVSFILSNLNCPRRSPSPQADRGKPRTTTPSPQAATGHPNSPGEELPCLVSYLRRGLNLSSAEGRVPPSPNPQRASSPAERLFPLPSGHHIRDPPVERKPRSPGPPRSPSAERKNQTSPTKKPEGIISWRANHPGQRPKPHRMSRSLSLGAVGRSPLRSPVRDRTPGNLPAVGSRTATWVIPVDATEPPPLTVLQVLPTRSALTAVPVGAAAGETDDVASSGSASVLSDTTDSITELLQQGIHGPALGCPCFRQGKRMGIKVANYITARHATRRPAVHSTGRACCNRGTARRSGFKRQGMKGGAFGTPLDESTPHVAPQVPALSGTSAVSPNGPSNEHLALLNPDALAFRPQQAATSSSLAQTPNRCNEVPETEPPSNATTSFGAMDSPTAGTPILPPTALPPLYGAPPVQLGMETSPFNGQSILFQAQQADSMPPPLGFPWQMFAPSPPMVAPPPQQMVIFPQMMAPPQAQMVSAPPSQTTSASGFFLYVPQEGFNQPPW